jgi:hypothetical protein
MLFDRKTRIVALVVFAVVGCGEPTTSARRMAIPSSPTKHVSVGSVVTDSVMGNLSLVARQVAVGLGNPTVRQKVVAAMKDPGAHGAGLDLSACGSGTVAADLLAAGEERGAGSAEALCSSISRSGGLTLYMSKDGLRRWDGSFVPIVTAVENSRGKLPKQWKGYRSGQRTIDLFADKPTPGPVLVVLRLTHPTRLANAPRTNLIHEVHVGPFAAGIPSRVPTPVARAGGAK